MLLLSLGGPKESIGEPLQRLEYFTQDLRAANGVKTAQDGQVLLIGIDRTEYGGFFDPSELQQDPTLKVLSQNFPWPRTVWADVIRKLADAGAKAIVLDLMLGGEREGDELLRETLDKYKDQVVVACNIHDLDSDRGRTLALDLPNASVLNSSNEVSAGFDERVGFVNLWQDSDGVQRSARYRLDAEQSSGLIPAGTMLESLAARALRKCGNKELIPKGSNPIRFRYTGSAGQGFRAISLGDVLSPKIWKSNFKSGEFFRGKIVVIGPTSDILQDTHRTPFFKESVMYGPEVHCNIIAAGLHQAFLRDSSSGQSLLIIAISGVIATVLSFRIQQPVKRTAVLVLLVIAYGAIGQALFNYANLVIPIAGPLLVLIVSGIVVLGFDYFAEQIEKNRIRKMFESQVSKNVVKEMVDNPDTYLNSLSGQRRPVAVLFCDLRNFTTMTENSRETGLFRNLNEYFDEMTKHVFAYDGTLDKFIGDAIMAVWGNIVSKGPDVDAQNAVATAFAMKAGLEKLNAKWRERGIPELSFGIGINHGEAISGGLGSEAKREITVIGDTVNTASRLEGLTKIFGVDMLLGESAAHLVQDKYVLRTVGLIQPKGKTKPSEVFTVLGERVASAKPDPWLAEYEAAVKLYRGRSFADALQKFKKCLEEKPRDLICERHIAECETLLKNPPDEKWNGVFVMTEK